MHQKTLISTLQGWNWLVSGRRLLLQELRWLIDDSRRQAAVAVNVGLTLLYGGWATVFVERVLGWERAWYGSDLLP